LFKCNLVWRRIRAQAFGCGSLEEFQDGQTKDQRMLNVPERLMVWCRAGIRSDFLSVYTDFFLRATNYRKPLKPACTIPCISCCNYSNSRKISSQCGVSKGRFISLTMAMILGSSFMSSKPPIGCVMYGAIGSFISYPFIMLSIAFSRLPAFQ
jgi:hypothetical protein